MKKCTRSVLSVMLVLAVVLTVISGAIPARAASYSGKGTMADPYIVTNAQQLQDMRENLSAHYRLGNTIDLTGVDFKPIGRLDGKFTGSFVCELNEDNTPKYVIKNLNVSVKESAYGSENKNKWEAALFGATDGATIMGIYVLNATISNDNFGDNRGSVIYNNYKPGMEEMNSAILIGDAENTTVTNCGTTGVIDTKSNHCGGLIGVATNSTIENCYSTADVTTAGYWNVGGLVGSASNCTITSCFATGNAKGGQSSVSSFIGSCGGTTKITDCYATGNATTVKEDASNFASLRGASGVELNNCYATGTVTQSVKQNTVGKFTANNCFTLAGQTSDMPGFESADMATIKSKLTGSNWDTTAEQPTLVNIGVVADASAYQPQNNTENPTNPSATEGPTQSGAEEVAAMIAALPDPTEDGTVTLDCKTAVVEAYTAYEALSVGQKDDFDAALAAKLLAIRSKLSVLLAGDVVSRIRALPEVDKLENTHIEEIKEMWSDFSFLDESVQSEIASSDIEKLNAAYAYAQEAETLDEKPAVDNSLTEFETVVVILCGVVFLCAISFDIVAGVVLIRKINSKK